MYNRRIAFETTLWSAIHAARDNRQTRNALLGRYGTAIRRYLLHRGFKSHDADDLTQEVLIEICREEFLRKADAEKGRFRSLLLAVIRNVVTKRLRDGAALKRGGGSQRVPLVEQIPAPVEEAAYNQAWASDLVRRALERLREANENHARAIELHFLKELPYVEIARALSRELHDVKNFIHQGKRRLREIVHELIRDYCSSAGEYRDELADLERYLP